jgi:hypothetical protein
MTKNKKKKTIKRKPRNNCKTEKNTMGGGGLGSFIKTTGRGFGNLKTGVDRKLSTLTGSDNESMQFAAEQRAEKSDRMGNVSTQRALRRSKADYAKRQSQRITDIRDSFFSFMERNKFINKYHELINDVNEKPLTPDQIMNAVFRTDNITNKYKDKAKLSRYEKVFEQLIKLAASDPANADANNDPTPSYNYNNTRSTPVATNLGLMQKNPLMTDPDRTSRGNNDAP